jgi:hypothetical protein
MAGLRRAARRIRHALRDGGGQHGDAVRRAALHCRVRRHGKYLKVTETATEVVETDPATFAFSVIHASRSYTAARTAGRYPPRPTARLLRISGTPLPGVVHDSSPRYRPRQIVHLPTHRPERPASEQLARSGSARRRLQRSAISAGWATLGEVLQLARIASRRIVGTRRVCSRVWCPAGTLMSQPEASCG